MRKIVIKLKLSDCLCTQEEKGSKRNDEKRGGGVPAVF